ncbi:MAG TPA: carboxypeptidase-like regulatory domain-containing protein [Solirubrobacteraceae bacterium]|nr:carboxypeptidase-like regulatory domain-containing protein [Solirubrobacteraceae bacterium]
MPRSLVWMALLWCAVACGSASGRAIHSGIAGRVVAGPTCPVERVPPDPQCAPRPLAAPLRVRRADGSGSGRVVHSSADGRFRVPLVPGRYTIVPLAPNGSPFPRPPRPITLTVRAGRYSRVTITYDTGIR